MSEPERLQFFDRRLRDACRQRGISCCDDLWQLSGEQVEAVNLRRGGHSEVLRVCLAGATPEQSLRFYLKRQQSQRRRTAATLFRAAPTYWHEWQAIERLATHGAFGPRLLCYGDSGHGNRAVLAVEALDGYVALDEFLHASPARAERDACLGRLGRLLRDLHRLGCAHGALYLKHIFVRRTDCRDLRLIDFERARFPLLAARAARRDMERLFRRAQQFDAADRAALSEAYLADD